ncbi:MAG: MBL fold metallo-hydrolase [Calditrichaeota bacterium]|nr:MAG: MBL fold metallo-hydrolase [Calditrichota bacterium]
MRMYLFVILPSILNFACSHNYTIAPNSGKQVQDSDIKVHIFSDLLSQSFLIETPQGLYAVDPGALGCEKKIIAKMKALSRKDLRLIFITHAHFDHYGAAAALKKKYPAPVAIHKNDAAAMAAGKTELPKVRRWGRVGRFFLPLGYFIWPPGKIEADIKFEDGFRFDEFGLDAEAIHFPGHTPGSSGLLVNGTILFAGDLVAAKHGAPTIQKLYAFDWQEIAESTSKAKVLNPHSLFPGHGRMVTKEEVQNLQPVVLENKD